MSASYETDYHWRYFISPYGVGLPTLLRADAGGFLDGTFEIWHPLNGWSESRGYVDEEGDLDDVDEIDPADVAGVMVYLSSWCAHWQTERTPTDADPYDLAYFDELSREPRNDVPVEPFAMPADQDAVVAVPARTWVKCANCRHSEAQHGIGFCPGCKCPGWQPGPVLTRKAYSQRRIVCECRHGEYRHHRHRGAEFCKVYNCSCTKWRPKAVGNRTD